MTLPHVIEAVVGLGLSALVAYRLWQLPKVLAARGLSSQVQALTGTITPLAQQPAALPWVQGGVGNSAIWLASNYYDPTTTTVAQTFNEFGFITSPSPAPVNPKTGKVPLTNIDVCNWVGHQPAVGGLCPRCGTAV